VREFGKHARAWHTVLTVTWYCGTVQVHGSEREFPRQWMHCISTAVEAMYIHSSVCDIYPQQWMQYAHRNGCNKLLSSMVVVSPNSSSNCHVELVEWLCNLILSLATVVHIQIVE